MTAIIFYIVIAGILLGLSVAIGTACGWIEDGDTFLVWMQVGILSALVWPVTAFAGLLALICYAIYRMTEYVKEIHK